MIKDLEKASFEELEKEINEVLEKLKSDSISLDEADSLYKYGMKITSTMEKKITDLQKSVQNIVEDN